MSKGVQNQHPWTSVSPHPPLDSLCVLCALKVLLAWVQKKS